MVITNQEVKKIASLVRLRFDEDEIPNIAIQLTNIMNMIDQLNEVDCLDVEPLASVSNMTLRMREDTAEVNDISDQLFANAPGDSSELAKKIKCFIVPKVVE
ncbi:MAG: Asp-tRNA(Asn)/Glu-tRNA(Gln) amidotransferase subunit GatC [Janthinobacterium lividum]